MNEAEQMKVLADQLFSYMKPKILQLMQSNVTFFRAEVVSNPGNNRLVIKRAFDADTMTLPCADCIVNVESGDQVTVFVYGNLSNAVVMGDGQMIHLGYNQKITASTQEPQASEGNDGDVWLVYTA